MSVSINRVLENLWVGSAPSRGEDVDGQADLLVLCATEYQPRREKFPNVTVLHAPLEDDELTPSEMRIALDASRQVAEAVGTGRRVWVTCLAGLNRSSFVAALAMRRLGWKPDQAIDAIRDARGPVALSNLFFETVIRELALEE